MMRRVFALGAVVLVIILVVLGIRGCLNARKERGFENYVSDLSALVTQSNQLSSDFFGLLENPPKGQDEQTLQAQIATDRGSAENLLERAEGLSTPDELNDAQTELVEAFALRRDALAGIATDIQAALGDEGSNEAIDRLTEQMRTLLASDVLYTRARDSIVAVLSEEGISGEVPESQFLPDPVDRWIDDLQLTTVLSSFANESGATTGTHGVALLSAMIDGTTLTADAENPVSIGSGAPTLTAEVQNQGSEEESDVTVTYTLSGGAVPIEGESSIATIDAQGVDDVRLPFEAQPETGTQMTLEVQVEPVLGEEVVDNNSFTYTVTFN